MASWQQLYSKGMRRCNSDWTKSRGDMKYLIKELNEMKRDPHTTDAEIEGYKNAKGIIAST